MKLEVMCVFDSAAEAYMRPMFVPARGMGMRAFADEVNRSAVDNALYQHPADFALYHMGSFDDNRGVFTLFDNPELVTRGVSVSERVMKDAEARNVS